MTRRVVLMCTLMLNAAVWMPDASAQDAGSSEMRMEELVKRCEALAADGSAVNTSGGYCVGFFTGMLNGIEVASIVSKTKVFCFPERMSIMQVVKIFLKRAKDHPELLHESARVEAAAALMEFFLCRTPKE